MGPVKDTDTELKRTDSARNIPILAQTAHITAEAEPLSASPKSASQSLAESIHKSAEDDADKELNSKATPSEGLPTPPDTPGPASTAEAAAEEVQEEEQEVEPPVAVEEPAEPTFPAELAGIEKRVEYHEDADLYIHARESDGTEAVYSVRAGALETVSRAWKESLATRTGNVVDAVSDPAFGLDILLSIAHYRFASLPQETDLQGLYDITIAADRYQALHLLVPFIKPWLASLDSSTFAEGGSHIDKALVLSWILGDAPLFAQLLSKSAYQAQISPDGVLLDAAGHAWSAQPVSKEVLGLLAATRLDAVDEIIKAVSTPVNKLLNPQWYPDEDTRYCHAPADDNAREYCEQLQLGSAIMGLSKAKLWPPPEASRVRASAAALAQSYTAIRMRRYQVPGLRFQQDGAADAAEDQDQQPPVLEDAHATCGFGHHAAMEAILGKPTPLFGSVVGELLAHAQTSGAFSEARFVDFLESKVGENDEA